MQKSIDGSLVTVHTPCVSDFHHRGFAVQFRPAEDCDFSFAWNLYWSFMRSMLALDVLKNVEIQRPQMRRNFFANHAAVILVDGSSAGWVEIEETADALLIHQIHLLRERQGQGIGTAIIRQIFTASQLSAKPVKLEVLRSNRRAFRLYRRLGFDVDESDAQKYYMARQCRGI